MLLVKQERAALFAKKLGKVGAKDSADKDGFDDDSSHLQWQLGLRDKKISGTGRAFNQTGKLSVSRKYSAPYGP